ncbi:hypothetical protein CDAR_573471 [Caerostris darwini]|uniref:Uncharacterized protein n=1 Tax=Caerostris darwini TaxID=1538125 RepID=A0AAV4VR76_9ARAC|nr:hypothetical protein CDAR_573471 [Caerostris darwini]
MNHNLAVKIVQKGITLFFIFSRQPMEISQPYDSYANNVKKEENTLPKRKVVFRTETDLVNDIIETVKESMEAEKREGSEGLELENERLEIDKMKAIKAITNIEVEQLILNQL